MSPKTICNKDTFVVKFKYMDMKNNMGVTDKVVRIAIAFLIAGLYYSDKISGITAIILLVFAAIFVVTSFLSFCPLYLPFGFSTRKKEK